MKKYMGQMPNSRIMNELYNIPPEEIQDLNEEIYIDNEED